MSRHHLRRVLPAAMLSVSALAGCAAQATNVPAPTGPPASTVRVGLVEWGFTRSASALVAGPVELDVTNAGSTPHDVQVLDGDKVLARSQILRPGEQQTLHIDATGLSGVTFLCTMPGHESEGMVDEVKVVAPTGADPNGRRSG